MVVATAWAMLTPFSAHADAHETLESIVASVEPATLVIYGTHSGTGTPVQGSGIAVGDAGLVLATAHQIAEVTGLSGANDDYRCTLEVIALDTAKDLALLRADPPPPAGVDIGNASDLAKGASVFALSAPAGLRLSLTTGTIATTGITLHEQPRVQVDMTLAEGASGGPVFTREGLLIGLISARAEGLEGFTIVTPINEAYALLDMHGVSLPEDAAILHEALDPAEGDASRRAAVLAYNRGVVAESTRDKVRHYEAAVAHAGDFFEAWFNLGAARTLEGDAAAAARAYREAHRLRPESQRVLRNYGQALLTAGDANGAVRVLTDLAERAPDDARVWNDLGEACRRMGRFDEAAGHFHQALSLDDSHAPTHFNLALLLVQLERRDEAIASFERYMELRPDAADAAEVREAIERLRKDLEQ